MLELLQGRPSERMVITMPPALKKAIENLVEHRDQDVTQFARHALAEKVAVEAAQREERG